MRFYFLLPIANGKVKQVINNIPNLTYDGNNILTYAKDNKELKFWISIQKTDYGKARNISVPNQTSNAANGNWDFWLLKPLGISRDLGPKVRRKLGRFFRQPAAEGWVLPPRSLKEMCELWPAFANKYIYLQEPDEWGVNEDGAAIPISWKPAPGNLISVPHIFFGENPVGMGEFDYRPSTEEEDNDTPVNTNVVVLPDD